VRMVVGLGNPGARWEGSRHNAGFAVIERLAERWGVAVERPAQRALVGDAHRSGHTVLLAKPQSFMNASGEAVAALCRAHGLGVADLVVVHDDVDVSAGRVKLRLGGGSGGNRGVESIIEALASPDFLRIKVGVGRPPPGVETADWVLAPVDPAEVPALETSYETAAVAVELVLDEGPARAMSRINQQEAMHGGSPL
jgi:peptidyl-tRNA hydrolase, PTH1 family